MPIYEYKCNKCAKVNEVLVNPGDTEKIICECGSTNLTKQFSRVNVSSGSSDKCDTCPGTSGSGPMPPCAGSGTCGL